MKSGLNVRGDDFPRRARNHSLRFLHQDEGELRGQGAELASSDKLILVGWQETLNANFVILRIMSIEKTYESIIKIILELFFYVSI